MLLTDLVVKKTPLFWKSSEVVCGDVFDCRVLSEFRAPPVGDRDQ